MSRVLVLGGCGFIGRNLVHHIITELDDEVSHVRVVDKTPPDCAFMHPDFEASFSSPKVEFFHLTLTDASQVAEAFDTEEPFDYVIDLAAETRFGFREDVYEQRSTQMGLHIVSEAQRRGIRLIYVSDARVYKPKSKLLSETSAVKPQHSVAASHWVVEQAIRETSGLDWIIVRPASVYGPGDMRSMMPRIAAAFHYRTEGTKMKYLWNAGLKLNTVHVEDVCRALIHLAQFGDSSSTWNLADDADTTQDDINQAIARIIGIEVGYIGATISRAARSAIGDATKVSNGNHLRSWNAVCQASGIQHTPISPFLDPEMLTGEPLSIDGTAIVSTGFFYTHPRVTAGSMMEILRHWQDMNLCPPL